MAATLNQLATRVLQKLSVLAANESPSPADRLKAIEKLKAAQYAIDAVGLLRWTSADIPTFAEEPLVLIAAALAASDFERPVDPSWMSMGMAMVAAGVNLRTTSTVSVDYF